MGKRWHRRLANLIDYYCGGSDADKRWSGRVRGRGAGGRRRSWSGDHAAVLSDVPTSSPGNRTPASVSFLFPFVSSLLFLP